MASQVANVIELFVERGLFSTPEQAMYKIACDYVLRQIECYQEIIENLETKYAMTYEQFDAYLASRSATLASHPDPALNQAVMAEEEDALDWKIAREMLKNTFLACHLTLITSTAKLVKLKLPRLRETLSTTFPSS
jgi:hypothetical protein